MTAIIRHTDKCWPTDLGYFKDGVFYLAKSASVDDMRQAVYYLNHSLINPYVSYQIQKEINARFEAMQ